IASRSIADRDDLGKVIELMALFAARNPARRENWRETEERVLKMMMDLASATPERWADQMRKAKADGYVPAQGEVSYEDMREFVEKDSYKITFATHHHLELEFKSWQLLAGLLGRRQWSLMRARPGQTGFVTTDQPVALMWSDDPNKRGFYGPGFGLAKTAVLFPVSNELALLGTFEGEPREGDLAERGVAMVNGTIIPHAHKQVYAAADDFAWSMQHTAGRVMRGSQLLADQMAGPPEKAEAEA
ncbi:MAG TPA: DUF4238 domain-containing protein, partial [Caulobacteraceae bacterium]|nr:DUF4238 domain-containing protein [Caulobacteraceae bacterium]